MYVFISGFDSCIYFVWETESVKWFLSFTYFKKNYDF